MFDPDDIPTPSSAQRRLFTVMMAIFFPLLGWLAGARPYAILIAAGVAATAAVISMLLNRDMPLRLQTVSLIIPASLALLGGAGRGGMMASWLIVGMVLIGLAFGALVWLRAAQGETIYRRWLLAAMPIGWSFAALIMTILFYLILTPVGLAMRLTGRDTMCRRFDPSSATYWLRHRPVEDRVRYFRQY